MSIYTRHSWTEKSAKRHGLTVQRHLFSVTMSTGCMWAQVVWEQAADCFTVCLHTPCSDAATVWVFTANDNRVQTIARRRTWL